MVKTLILPFLLLAACCKGQSSNVAADYIRIDHTGPIDKPIIPLIISTEKLTLPITELSIQVSPDIFISLTGYIENCKYLDLKKTKNEFGVFKITSVINGKTKTGFTSERNKSIHFFKDLLNAVYDKHPTEQLTEEIEAILRRIDFESK